MSVTVSEQDVRVDGVPVASATIVDDGADVQLRIEIIDTHAPARARRELMEKAFRLPALRRPRRISVSIPLGEPDLLASVAKHLDELRSRAAGVTCLIEGVVTAEESDHDHR